MRIIGIVDAEEHGACDCCGKQAGPELKSLTVVQDTDGEIHHFGCACASRILGMSGGAEVRRMAMSKQGQPVREAIQHFITWKNADGTTTKQSVMKNKVLSWVRQLRREGIEHEVIKIVTHPAR